MKTGDIITGTAIVKSPEKSHYTLVLQTKEYTVKCHGNESILKLDIDAIIGCTVTVLTEPEVGSLVFAFAKQNTLITWSIPRWDQEE
jgi:hypothetical protein